jgi:hypothetical protein
MSGLEQQVIEPMRRVSGPIQPELTRSRMQLANVAVGATPAVALQSSADRNPPSCDVHARDPQCSLYVDSSRPECANSGHCPPWRTGQIDPKRKFPASLRLAGVDPGAERPSGLLRRRRSAREGHQISAPATSAATWMPHSIFARPRQRPARASSPVQTPLVHGRQPIEGKPSATSG